MTVLCVHRQKPNWPEDPKRPRFLRTRGGVKYWVETDGEPPTAKEIAALVNPEDVAGA